MKGLEFKRGWGKAGGFEGDPGARDSARKDRQAWIVVGEWQVARGTGAGEDVTGALNDRFRGSACVWWTGWGT